MGTRTVLATTRKKAAALEPQRNAEAEGRLAQAFVTFTQAAGSLERSYTQLQHEVARLRGELAKANAELEQSVEENRRMRGYLAQVLENLPCGVVVAEGGGTRAARVQVLNPEARRLLGIAPEWDASQREMPEALARLVRQTGEAALEEEWQEDGPNGPRYVAVTRAKRTAPEGTAGDRIWILRDVTREKRLAEEREAARKSRALAEIATLLAHEIRNPLGSMELFTGLLAEASAHSPEAKQWINHLQAGLRSLSATITNVVDVYINYLRRKIDNGCERPLIRTVRGVGYQIGRSPA